MKYNLNLTARDLLERLVRAEWALSDASNASGLYSASEAESIADADWGSALADSIAFLKIERQPNPFDAQDVPLSPQNRNIVKRNMDNWLEMYLAKSNCTKCPKCGSIVSKNNVNTVEKENKS